MWYNFVYLLDHLLTKTPQFWWIRVVICSWQSHEVSWRWYEILSKFWVCTSKYGWFFTCGIQWRLRCLYICSSYNNDRYQSRIMNTYYKYHSVIVWTERLITAKSYMNICFSHSCTHFTSYSYTPNKISIIIHAALSYCLW